jgi:hypothetical protein
MPFICTTIAFALLSHNPDTSYVRITISPEQIQTRLTYDVFTLLKITPLDDNNDGQLQRTELDAHTPQIADFLRAHIGLATSDDDDTADLGQFKGFVWPPDIGDKIAGVDFHSANGLIHFSFERATDQPPLVVAISFGFFEAFTDRHTILGVFSCKGDEYETSFSPFEDTFEYFTGYEPAPSPHGDEQKPAHAQTRHTLPEQLWRFFKMGVKHIFEGYDHLCFLIALLVVSRFRDVVKIVTSFTIAHSITLILAALDVVKLDPRLVETSIAATIVYVALENIWLLSRRSSSTSDLQPTTANPFVLPRWLLTFFFGLIHGFGFAGVLRELGLPTVGLVRCLLSFNLGVEFGQLVIALCLLPLTFFLFRSRYIALTVSALLALFGLAWFLDRAFNLEFMQRFGL